MSRLDAFSHEPWPADTAAVFIDDGGHPATMAAAVALSARIPRPEVVVVSYGRPQAPVAPPNGVMVVHCAARVSFGSARNIGLAAASAPRVRFCRLAPDGDRRVLGDHAREEVAPVGAFADATSVSAGRPRIFAMITFRNERHLLDDYLANAAPQFDGIVALDDGSSDGSGEVAAAHPAVREVLRIAPRDPHRWNGLTHRRLLVNAAARHGAQWVLALDADERVERGFRARANRLLADAGPDGPLAYDVALRELWDRADQYRVDGRWGRARVARFFRLRRDHDFGAETLEGTWAPENSRVAHGGFAPADLIIYHLTTIHADDRERRMRRSMALDPERQWSRDGYGYLVDTEGLELEPLPAGREYEPLRLAVRPAASRRPERVVLAGRTALVTS